MYDVAFSLFYGFIAIVNLGWVINPRKMWATGNKLFPAHYINFNKQEPKPIVYKAYRLTSLLSFIFVLFLQFLIWSS